MGSRIRDDAHGTEDGTPADDGARRRFVLTNASGGLAWVQRIGAPGYDPMRAWDDPGARIAGAATAPTRTGRSSSCCARCGRRRRMTRRSCLS